MKVTFLLPSHGRKAVGGIKVVYEYANHLVRRGHDVSIVHPAGMFTGLGKNDRWYKNLAKYVLFAIFKTHGPKEWFQLDSRVHSIWTLSLNQRHIPKADVIVATAWDTAEYVAGYPADRGAKHYLIQHFEDWFGDRERLIATWKLPLRKIVISRWLENIAHDLGETACYIPNGLDFDTFGVDVLPELRHPASVVMLYHHVAWKGSAQGIAALEMVRNIFSDLEVTLFGVEEPVAGEVPDWMTFAHKPSRQQLRGLYNNAAIFVSPSWAEGWALPPAEAMQCGCATIITRIGGHEYAKENITSLMFEPKDVNSLSQAVCRLIENNEQRLSFANSGVDEIAQYTWQRATNALEAYFRESI